MTQARITMVGAGMFGQYTAWRLLKAVHDRLAPDTTGKRAGKAGR